MIGYNEQRLHDSSQDIASLEYMEQKMKILLTNNLPDMEAYAIIYKM